MSKWAYTGIVDKTGFSIGRADEGTRGYTPVPSEGRFESYEAAQKHADKLNEARGMSAREGLLIALSTMRVEEDNEQSS